MTTLLTIVHVVVSLFLIGIVLLQHGKGADIGATFGGSSQSLFGTEGPVPLLNKITTVAAIVFMGTSISLAYISANRSTGTVMEEVTVQPAVPQERPAQNTQPITIPVPTEPANRNNSVTVSADKETEQAPAAQEAKENGNTEK